MNKNLKSFEKSYIKNFVKSQIEFLGNYTEKEEDFLICESLNLTNTQLCLLKEFDKTQIKILLKVIKERKKGKPLNKIFKKAYFYDEELFINNSVLAPRKETEILVEEVLKYCKGKENLKILDLCCGSGAIGLLLAKHMGETNKFVLSDISKKALRVANKNKTLLKLSKNIFIKKSDLFKNLKSQKDFDIIVSNPPYIKTKDMKNLDKSVLKYDPKLALDGGNDGLLFYKKILKVLKDFLKPDGAVFFEIGFDEGKDVKTMLENTNFEAKIIKDYSGNDRIVFGRQKGKDL